MRARPFVAAAAALTMAIAGTAFATAPSSGSAQSAERAEPQVSTLAKGLNNPLSLAVADDGTRYFSENFSGRLMKQVPGAQPTVLFKARKGVEVGAVSESDGIVNFALSEGNNAKGTILSIARDGRITTLGKIHRAEKRENPDGNIRYGFRHLKPSCARQIGDDFGPVSYKGVKETHPYATTQIGATTYVADAAANAVFQVSEAGAVSPLAVIPSARGVVTVQAAEGIGLPDCTIGKGYHFEPVPTDVEVGPNGKLYVTTLPGGPEDGSVGALASVYRVDPVTGDVRKVVGTLTSAVGLAVDANGDFYVSELFRGRITKIDANTAVPRKFLKTPLPTDVEVGPAGIFALVNAVSFGPGKPKGKLVQITP